MFRSGVSAMAVAAVAAAGVATSPTAAQARQPEGIRVAGGWSVVAGVGHFVYDEPGTVGHRIWFGVQAVAAAGGSTYGQFRYRHELPDGTVVGQGRADVTCLEVTGNVAVFTAIVPEGQGAVRNHGYYVKVIDGGRGPDQIVDAQAQNGTEPPPTECLDPETDLPAGVPPRPRYPVLVGGYVVHRG
ncbi:hypothetical protein ACFOOK_05040 [Micromonospora krabiensis]|uniref:Secreted protein n=1 Tax=Micromonospora krabiensis TaxID=307121 RepID=A0A1C3NDL5_9ACTN|nr:hypothetical protein [Micromonospora krabiensis]SBV30641.1 hypothetical protein GA0070620_6241 [Micromonospora krabiensis]